MMRNLKSDATTGATSTSSLITADNLATYETAYQQLIDPTT